MSSWFHELTEDLVSLPIGVWFLLAGLVLFSILLIILILKHAPRWSVITVSVLLLAGLISSFAILLPLMEVSSETTSAVWLYSPLFWTVVVSLIGLVALFFLLRKTNWTSRMLSTGALCLTASFVLDCLVLFHLPQGGGIRLAAMLPILFFAWVYGPGPGIAAGIAHSLLTMVMGIYVIHPVQFLMDYIFPFAALGLAGVFRGEKTFPVAIAVACFLRFLFHFLSGWIFFGAYAPEGQSAFVYSLLYNGGYMLVNTAICIIVAVIPPVNRLLIRLRRNCLDKQAS